MPPACGTGRTRRAELPRKPVTEPMPLKADSKSALRPVHGATRASIHCLFAPFPTISTSVC